MKFSNTIKIFLNDGDSNRRMSGKEDHFRGYEKGYKDSSRMNRENPLNEHNIESSYIYPMNGDNTRIHSTLEEGYDFFITDQWNKRYHFKIATFKVPPGYLPEAIEVIVDHEDHEPRIFHVLSDFYADKESQESILKEKIKKGINKRYLDNKDNAFSISDDLEVAGRILSDVKLINSGESGFDCFFVIDGRKITIETFVEMLHEYVGWNFRFKIYDTTEDIDH